MPESYISTDTASSEKPVKTACGILWVPKGFDPYTVLPFKLRKYGDELAFILNLLSEARALRLGKDRDGFVYLKVEYMRKGIPQKVLGPLLDWCVDEKIIERDNRYTIGVHSRSYRLGEQFRQTRCDPLPISAPSASTGSNRSDSRRANHRSPASIRV